MLLPRLVVERRPLLHCGDEACGIERLYGLQRRHLLRQIEKVPPVAVGHGAERGASVVGEFERLAIMLFGPLEQRLERRVVEPAQHENLRARKQRAVELE